MDLLEKSPRTYQVDTVEKAPAQWRQQALLTMYPRAEHQLDEPRLGADGVISEASHPPELTSLLEPVEAKFEAKEFAEAEKAYAALLKKYPGNFMLTLSWGDAALFDRRPEVALERYRAAQKLNPIDHRGYFYEGTALVALGKPKEALDAYAKALARRPNAQFVVEGVDARGERLGVRVRTTPLLPGARVDAKGEGFQVSLADVAWLPWGMCKAAWRGEVAARNVADPEHYRPTMTEERECLIQLLAVYRVQTEHKKQPIDAQLEWLKKVQQAGLLDALIVYELLSRAQPHVTLTLDAKGLSAIEQYVRRFVFEPR